MIGNLFSLMTLRFSLATLFHYHLIWHTLQTLEHFVIVTDKISHFLYIMSWSHYILHTIKIHCIIFPLFIYLWGDYYQCLPLRLVTSMCHFMPWMNSLGCSPRTCPLYYILSPLSLARHHVYIMLFSMPHVPLPFWDPQKIRWAPHVNLPLLLLLGIMFKPCCGMCITMS